MIQRIQSLYLFITALVGGLSAYFTDLIPQNKYDMIILSGIAVLALLSIFLFKNRKAQKNLNKVNVLVNLGLIGLTAYYLLTTSGGVENISPEKGVGFLIPLFLIITLVVANKYITKDEKLVKSVDRFR